MIDTLSKKLTQTHTKIPVLFHQIGIHIQSLSKLPWEWSGITEAPKISLLTSTDKNIRQ